MTRMTRALALAGAMMVAGSAYAQPVKLGALTITSPWVRPTPPGAPSAAGYLNIVNHGSVTDRLVGATTPDAASVQVHEMSMTSNGVMKMRPVPGGLAIPPGKTVALAPGGYHLMIIGPTQEFKAGESVPVTLIFKHAGKVAVSFPVANGPAKPAGAMGAMPGMTMGAMPGKAPAKP